MRNHQTIIYFRYYIKKIQKYTYIYIYTFFVLFSIYYILCTEGGRWGTHDLTLRSGRLSGFLAALGSQSRLRRMRLDLITSAAAPVDNLKTRRYMYIYISLYIHIHIQIQIHIHIHIHTHIHIHIQYTHTYIHTYIHTYRQTDGQAGRQAGRQT